MAEAIEIPRDEVTGRALRDIATVCKPFVRSGAADGVRSVCGVAVTAERDRYNVHTVVYDERTARWEGQNGHYGVTWEVARVELNRRADGETRP